MPTHSFQFVSLSLRRAMRLMFIACCCVAFATFTQAQSSSYDFVVPGTSGPNWVDTGLYLPPNTVLQLRATGEVDVSAGWGSHGPEGTPRPNCAPVSGYPVEGLLPVEGPRNCYGLVARLTTDFTFPTPSSPEVRALWTYPESDGYFAAPHGGHFWLTVNDDNPGDNKGAFKVHVEVTTFPPPEKPCHPCPTDEFTVKDIIAQPLPDPKALKTLLVLDGEITAIEQSGGKTLVTVSPGSVLAKYGDLPNLLVFEKSTVRPALSLSKENVIQGVVFQNKKMSLITGASRLSGRKEGKQ